MKNKSSPAPSLAPSATLDDTDWRLVEALQRDARQPYSALAKLVGLTAPAVTERLRRLEESGVITGYHARVDAAKLGLAILAVIRVSVPGELCGKLGAILSDWPEVIEAHRVTGTDSYVMTVRLRSVAHMEALIDRVTPYGTTTTSIVLSSPVTARMITRASSTAPRAAARAKVRRS